MFVRGLVAQEGQLGQELSSLVGVGAPAVSGFGVCGVLDVRLVCWREESGVPGGLLGGESGCEQVEPDPRQQPCVRGEVEHLCFSTLICVPGIDQDQDGAGSARQPEVARRAVDRHRVQGSR